MEDRVAELIELAMWPVGFFVVLGVISILTLLLMPIEKPKPSRLRTRKAEL